MTAANIRSGRLRELAFCQPDEGDKCRYRPLCQAAQRRALQLSLADAECSASGQVCPGNAAHSEKLTAVGGHHPKAATSARGPAPPFLYPRRDRLRVGPGLPAQRGGLADKRFVSSPSTCPPGPRPPRPAGQSGRPRARAARPRGGLLVPASSRHRARCRASPQISAISRRSASGRFSIIHSSIAAGHGLLSTPRQLFSRRPHRLGQRLTASLEFHRNFCRQIRVIPRLADQLADHVRRGDVAGLRITAQEPVKVGRQVDGDPGRPQRPPRGAGSSRTGGTTPCSASRCSTGGTADGAAGAARSAALRIPSRPALGDLAGLMTSAPRAGHRTRRTRTARSRN